jgi:hypothetical protein
MTKRFLMLVAVLVLTAAPMFAACTQGTCPIGPCVCFIENGDQGFTDTTCSLWSFVNNAARGLSGGNYFGSFPSGTATISQTVWGGNTGNDIELQVDVTVNPSGSPGNEKLYIEVRTTGGTLLETLDIISANESTGHRVYTSSGYGSDVILRFRRAPSTSDGGSSFEVDNVKFWRCGF